MNITLDGTVLEIVSSFVILLGELIIILTLYSSKTIYSKSIHDLFRHHLGQFMYRLENKVLPNNFYDMSQKSKSSCIHTYPTRHSNKFHLPLTRTILTHSTVCI